MNEHIHFPACVSKIANKKTEIIIRVKKSPVLTCTADVILVHSVAVPLRSNPRSDTQPEACPVDCKTKWGNSFISTNKFHQIEGIKNVWQQTEGPPLRWSGWVNEGFVNWSSQVGTSKANDEHHHANQCNPSRESRVGQRRMALINRDVCYR